VEKVMKKFLTKVHAGVYEAFWALKSALCSNEAIWGYYSAGVSLDEKLFEIVKEFSSIPRIKKAMDDIGFNDKTKYFRSKYMGIESKYSKPRQAPIVFIPGVTPEPFPDRAKFPWANDFEKNYSIILEEFRNVAENEGIRSYHIPEVQGRAVVEKWHTFFFSDHYGQHREENIKKCPKTWELLNRIPGFVSNNMTMFSVLEPHSTISPHAGWCNLFTRVHLTLINKEPNKVAINVGDEVRTWREKELLFLDDSFLHQVWNSSNYNRAVLFFDVWHPDFSEEEIRQLNEIYDRVKKNQILKDLSKKIQEIEAKSSKKRLEIPKTNQFPQG
jgi:aspartyl/asparaginyl beta-hydroxylase (cupin superfamily)